MVSPTPLLSGGSLAEPLSLESGAGSAAALGRRSRSTSTVLWSPQHEADPLRSSSADRFLPL